MFARVRSWVDIAPWIRLTRTLRILSSPSYVSATFLLCLLLRLAGVSVKETWARYSFASLMPSNTEWTARFVNGRFDVTVGEILTILLVPMFVLVSVFVFQVVARAGVMLTAGHDLPAASESIRLIATRFLKSLVLVFVPFACVTVFAGLAFLVRLPGWFTEDSWWNSLIGGLFALACVPLGLLGFGALFAIPLGLVAMVSEPDPDPIDSLSRGYEYLYRRPLHLVFYASVSSAILYVASFVLGGICATIEGFSAWMATLVFERSGEQLGISATVLTLFESWLLTLAISLIAGSYLLLRYNAGGQEVEEVFHSTPPADQPLPQLPHEAYES